MEAVLHYLHTSGYARATMNGFMSDARCFFRWLYQAGKILTDPTNTLAGGQFPEAPLPPPPLSELDMIQFIDAIPQKHVIDIRNRAIVELLYGCGLRISECLALELKSLDMQKRTVFIEGKGGHERMMPLMSGAFTALKQYLTLRKTLLRGPDAEWLFISRRGNRLSPVTFGKWMTKHGHTVFGPERRVFPHLLRHSIAVHLLRGGADIKHVQTFLGHADMNTTKVYLRLLPGHLREAYDRSMPVLL